MERKSIKPSGTAIAVLWLYCQKTSIRRERPFQYSSCVLSKNETSHQVAKNSRSSSSVVLPWNENPSSRRERPLQYFGCTARKHQFAGNGRSSTQVVYYQRARRAIKSPRTVVLVVQLYYQRTKIHQAVGNGHCSTLVVLQENEKPSSRKKRPFQYLSCTTRETPEKNKALRTDVEHFRICPCVNIFCAAMLA